MKKKVLISIFLLIIFLCNLSFSSYSNVTMTVVEEPVCTIELGENSKFEKKLISKNLSNKEVTIQLQVTNNETLLKATGEIMLVIDNSSSMTDTVSEGVTRKDLVINSAKTLITNLLKYNSSLKIGVVTFSTNSDVEKRGTTEDATLISELSSDVDALTSAISKIDDTGDHTNLDAGLTLANEYFSDNDTNKYMLVLTDGVPNVSLDFNKYMYSDDVLNKTKAKLKLISDSGVNIITLLTGITNEDSIPNPSVSSKSYIDIINEIFGTAQDPTVGDFYYIQDNEIEKTIVEDIYNSLIDKENYFKNITIVDYFPQEIIDNFDFEYVSSPNIGTISTKVDTGTNSITWNIEVLNSGEVATVQYKLKLKENYSSDILDKVLDTNVKVDIDYTDIHDKTKTKTSDVTPKIKLTEPKTTTESPIILPKAGSPVLLGFSILAVGALIFFLVKYVVINNKFK